MGLFRRKQSGLDIKWLLSLPAERLNQEREKIRVAYCKSTVDDCGRYQNILHIIDRELSKRAWGDEEPCAPSLHREHGWYLPNDD